MIFLIQNIITTILHIGKMTTYFSSLPLDICETLTYYIHPLYILEVFKLDCFSSLINNEKFWKNKLKHNHPDIYSDVFPLYYCKNMCMKLALANVYDLQMTINAPHHSKDFNID